MSQNQKKHDMLQKGMKSGNKSTAASTSKGPLGGSKSRAMSKKSIASSKNPKDKQEQQSYLTRSRSNKKS